jgi:hypothetical protein
MLQCVINKFHTCVVQVKQFNQSGASSKDQLNCAYCLFSKDQQTRFKHIQCYTILTQCPKWHPAILEGQKKATTSAAKKKKKLVIQVKKPHPVYQHQPWHPSPPLSSNELATIPL